MIACDCGSTGAPVCTASASPCLGATGYGVLLAAAGAGAVIGAVLMPLLRRRWSPSRLLTLAGAVFGLGLLGLAVAPTPLVAILVLLPVGVAWIAGLNATTQAFLPDWVRARALAVYQMVLFAAFARSAAAWGAVANWVQHQGQHERRLTLFDADVVQRAAALAQEPPQVAHLLVLALPDRDRRRPPGEQP